MASKTSASSGAGGGAAKATPQYFSLRWNNHPVNLVSVFTGLYNTETLVDVTLAAEGKHLQAHKMLLSACSDYFQSLFSVNPCQHPIVILKDVSFEDLQTVVQFMYNGIVNVSSEKLPDILKTAETLQIKGLAEKFSESMGGLLSNSGSLSRRGLMASTSYSSSRLLSVPSQHSVGSRQLSTESLPEYFNRTHSPRQPSVESRQYSIESMSGAIPSTSSVTKRNAPSPPLSPTRLQFRKKFRRMSGGGSSSERGNSIEDDRSPSHLRSSSPPAIHLSPSRQSSSSTDGGGARAAAGGGGATPGTIVAKKKRELFSARSSRSGGSNKSSGGSEYHSSSSKHLESTGSSGERQNSMSMSQSVEDPNVTTINLQSSIGSSLAVPRPTRTLGRTQSAGEVPASLSRSESEAAGSCRSPDPAGGGLDGRRSTTPTKRSRFLLKRQDCLEKGNETELDLSIMKSSPNSPLMLPSPYPSLGSPPPAHDNLPMSSIMQDAPGLIKQRSAEIQLDINPEPFYNDPSSANCPPPAAPPIAHKLPSVRVIPDASMDGDPLSLEMAMHEGHHPHSLPPSNNNLNYGLLHPNFRSRSIDQYRPSSMMPPHDYMHPYVTSAPNLVPYTTASSSIAVAPPPLMNTSSAAISVTEQFGHCPKERDGPALGCNYCWNTTDLNGRILRRKTKYHCPDCQANLCIVPCFQAYHEALDKDKAEANNK